MMQSSLGSWSGIISVPLGEGDKETTSVFTLRLHPSETDGGQLVAIPLLNLQQWMCTQMRVTAECHTASDGKKLYAVTMTPNTSFLQTAYLRLRLSDDGSTLTGWCNANPTFDIDKPPIASSSVIMKRGLSTDIMSFYPSASQLCTNKAQALWHFAISTASASETSPGTS